MPLKHARYMHLSLQPMSITDLTAVGRLYERLTDGQRLRRMHTAILRLRGDRLCLTAHDEKGSLVGVLIFYFNVREWREGSVHEAYVGLTEEVRGMGLATFMRRQALLHFAEAGIARCSSRITATNRSSLEGNLKLGYVPVESYFDPERQEKRQYLICDLDKYRAGSTTSADGQS